MLDAIAAKGRENGRRSDRDFLGRAGYGCSEALVASGFVLFEGGWGGWSLSYTQTSSDQNT